MHVSAQKICTNVKHTSRCIFTHTFYVYSIIVYYILQVTRDASQAKQVSAAVLSLQQPVCQIVKTQRFLRISQTLLRTSLLRSAFPLRAVCMFALSQSTTCDGSVEYQTNTEVKSKFLLQTIQGRNAARNLLIM